MQMAAAKIIARYEIGVRTAKRIAEMQQAAAGKKRKAAEMSRAFFQICRRKWGSEKEQREWGS
jgi:hypothetical protein